MFTPTKSDQLQDRCQLALRDMRLAEAKFLREHLAKLKDVLKRIDDLHYILPKDASPSQENEEKTEEIKEKIKKQVFERYGQKEIMESLLESAEEDENSLFGNAFQEEYSNLPEADRMSRYGKYLSALFGDRWYRQCCIAYQSLKRGEQGQKQSEASKYLQDQTSPLPGSPRFPAKETCPKYLVPLHNLFYGENSLYLKARGKKDLFRQLVLTHYNLAEPEIRALAPFPFSTANEEALSAAIQDQQTRLRELMGKISELSGEKETLSAAVEQLQEKAAEQSTQITHQHERLLMAQQEDEGLQALLVEAKRRILQQDHRLSEAAEREKQLSEVQAMAVEEIKALSYHASSRLNAMEQLGAEKQKAEAAIELLIRKLDEFAVQYDALSLEHSGLEALSRSQEALIEEQEKVITKLEKAPTQAQQMTIDHLEKENRRLQREAEKTHFENQRLQLDLEHFKSDLCKFQSSLQDLRVLLQHQQQQSKLALRDAMASWQAEKRKLEKRLRQDTDYWINTVADNRAYWQGVFRRKATEIVKNSEERHSREVSAFQREVSAFKRVIKGLEQSNRVYLQKVFNLERDIEKKDACLIALREEMDQVHSDGGAEKRILTEEKEALQAKVGQAYREFGIERERLKAANEALQQKYREVTAVNAQLQQEINEEKTTRETQETTIGRFTQVVEQLQKERDQRPQYEATCCGLFYKKVKEDAKRPLLTGKAKTQKGGYTEMEAI